MKEVELWENERFNPSSGWSKQNLRAEECKGWARGVDGWNDVTSLTTGDTGYVFSYAAVRGYLTSSCVEILHFRCCLDGRSLRLKTGEKTLKRRGVTFLLTLVGIFLSSMQGGC